MKKFMRFIEYVIHGRIVKLTGKMTDYELIDLYNEYAVFYWSTRVTTMKNKVIGTIIVYAVGEELKRRHPNKDRLQNWNYNDQVNLYDLIK